MGVTNTMSRQSTNSDSRFSSFIRIPAWRLCLPNGMSCQGSSPMEPEKRSVAIVVSVLSLSTLHIVNCPALKTSGFLTEALARTKM